MLLFGLFGFFFFKELPKWIKWGIEYTSQFGGLCQPSFFTIFKDVNAYYFTNCFANAFQKCYLVLVQIIVRLRNISKAKQNIIKWHQTDYSIFIPSLLHQWKLSLWMHVCIKFYKKYTEIIIWLLKTNADSVSHSALCICVLSASLHPYYNFSFIMV